MLVVSDSFHGVSNHKRREIVKACVDRKNLDPICLTIQEYETMLHLPSDFALSVLSNCREL